MVCGIKAKAFYRKTVHRMTMSRMPLGRMTILQTDNFVIFLLEINVYEYGKAF